MQVVVLILLAVMPALVIVGGLHDLATMKIPNWISLGLLAVFAPVALVVGLAPIDIALHFGVGVLALLVGMGLFALNWIGGGDAKLAATTCLWMGPSAAINFLLFTAVAGGLFCVLLMIGRAQAPKFLGPAAPKWLQLLLAPNGDIPYGVAIAIGALLAYPSSQLVQAFVGA